MIKKMINFLDKHRMILVLLILFLIVLIFLAWGSILFWTHQFEALKCTDFGNEEYCYHENEMIFKNPEEMKKDFFRERENEVRELQEKYKLPKFTKYTAYYYEVVALIDYNMYQGREDIYNFFHIYSKTYQLESFYKKYNFYYSIYFPFKVSIN